MHSFLRLNDIEEKELFPGFFAKLIHTEGVSIAHLRIVAGSELPEHFHPHEQITNVLEGELEMTVGGEKKINRAGEVVVIPSNVPHSGKAITDCLVIDVFRPARDDYK